jgi:peptidoglycan/LPS O-acetylase OafA/YrhL
MPFPAYALMHVHAGGGSVCVYMQEAIGGCSDHNGVYHFCAVAMASPLVFAMSSLVFIGWDHCVPSIVVVVVVTAGNQHVGGHGEWKSRLALYSTLHSYLLRVAP